MQNKVFVLLQCKTGKAVANLVPKQEKWLRNLLQNSKMRSKTGCKIEQYDAKLVAKQQKRSEICCKAAKMMRNVMENSKM